MLETMNVDEPIVIRLIGDRGHLVLFLAPRHFGSRQDHRCIRNMHSLPHYYGFWVAIAAVLPAFLLFTVWSAVEETVFAAMAERYFPADRDETFRGDIALTQIVNVTKGIRAGEVPDWVEAAALAWMRWQDISQLAVTAIVLGMAAALGFVAYRQVNPDFRARNWVEKTITVILAACSLVAIFTTIGIVFSVIFESIRFFNMVSPLEFLFGLKWNPQIEFGENAGSGISTYGAVPLFAGTLLISVIALLVAVPTGLFSAIYLSEYASQRVRSVVKPLMEILAGIPTVVYGFFAALTVAPFFREVGQSIA